MCDGYSLLVVVEQKPTVAQAALLAVTRHLADQLGVEVRLDAVALATFQAPPPTLQWADIGLGGFRVLAGDASVLGKPRGGPLSGNAIEWRMAQAACALAVARLGPTHSPFRELGRFHDLVLACGDVALLDQKAYVGTHLARSGALQSIVTASRAAAYAEAVAFRATPLTWTESRCPSKARFEAERDRLRMLAREWHLELESEHRGLPADALVLASKSRTRSDESRWAWWLSSLGAALRGWHWAAVIPFVGPPTERLARVAVGLAHADDLSAALTVSAKLLGTLSAEPEDVRQALLRLLAHVA
jgi:hypothetical protein